MLKSSDCETEIVVSANVASAESASLTYATDLEPGIGRRKSGAGFCYVDGKGKPITLEKTLARIRKLAIPPAWTDVWISPDEHGHLQATGRDVRGRKQYRYHERWRACRDDVKYSSLVAFAKHLPALREKVEADLSLRGLPREKVLATVVWLLDNAMIRVGNMAYAKDNKSFGLTTLRDRHVKIEGSTLRFAFRGKSGKEWNLKISDRRIARIVKSVQDIPGQHLFQYFDENGERRAIGSQDVNAYIRDITAGRFTSKHFRTWAGTVTAANRLAQTALPESQRATRIALNAAIDDVSGVLGNTRAVCRKCYIHPKVVDAWLEGGFDDDFSSIAKRMRKLPDGLDLEEAVTLRWLEKQSG